MSGLADVWWAVRADPNRGSPSKRLGDFYWHSSTALRTGRGTQPFSTRPRINHGPPRFDRLPFIAWILPVGLSSEESK